MITVDAALGHIFDLVTPLPFETVPLRAARNRVLAEPVIAKRDQPPFAASVMDGYAVPSAEAAEGDRFRVVGEAAAGSAFKGAISGQYFLPGCQLLHCSSKTRI